MTPGMSLSVKHLLKGFSEGDMLSVKQVCRRLKVSDRHIRELLITSQMKGMKVGKTIWRIPFESYREYVLHIAQEIHKRCL